MICSNCVYALPAPGYPPETVNVCTHFSTVSHVCQNLPKEKWHGQACELAILICKGRGWTKK